MNCKTLERIAKELITARKEWGNHALAMLEDPYGSVHASPSHPLWERKILGLRIKIMPGSELILRLEHKGFVATRAITPWQVLELRTIVKSLCGKFPREQGMEGGVYIGVKALKLPPDCAWPTSPQRETPWEGFQLTADVPPQRGGNVAKSFTSFTTLGPVWSKPTKFAPPVTKAGNTHGIYALWSGRRSLVLSSEIHSYYATREAAMSKWSPHGTTHTGWGTCVAVVQAHGRVVVGSQGFRAEKCLIKDLYVEQRYRSHPILRKAPEYGVTIKELERGHWKGAWSRNRDSEAY